MKVLLIEDEKRMAQALQEILRLENYEIDWHANGLSGEYAILNGDYELIILDVMLPGRSGLEIADTVRKKGIQTPILMLSARSELDDKVLGLDCGADDYLTKPFETRELLARIRALMRRFQSQEDPLLIFGDLRLHLESCTLECTASNRKVGLKEKEFRILECMMRNQGRVLSRQLLADRIWGWENTAEYNNVEVYMSFTRKKLAFLGSKVDIKARRGLGYEIRYPDVSKDS